jgi:hypothetical protein
MIFISSKGFCGEDDFRVLRLKKPGYRRERQGAKRVYMFWIWKVFRFFLSS